MSRIGNKPVVLPANVKAALQEQQITIQGPKGKLSLDVHPRIKLSATEKEISVARATNIPADRALHGLTRSLLQNMVKGVTDGFSKELDIEGVGFKAQVKGKMISLSLGYTHPVEYHFPQDIEVKCATPTRILITGIDKQKVGQVAADIRSYHEPEPYKGKGIRYVGEQVRRKQGKTVG